MQTLLHALYYLAAHPEYAQAMRDEINEVVDENGWTYTAVRRITKLDSFIKESQRLNALSCRKFVLETSQHDMPDAAKL